MKKLLWLCICCFAILLEISATHFTDSLLYFEHKVFESNTIDEKNFVLLQKYFYQKRNLQFSEGLKTLNRIIPLDDETAFIVLYEQAINNYILQEYVVFEQNVFTINNNFKNYNNNKIQLLNMLLHIQQFEFNKAKESLQAITTDEKLKNKIDSLFDLSKYKKQKSENKAVLLSTFLPGTGQWYAGNFKQGAINAGIILSLLGWGAYNALNNYYITALFSGFFIAYTFYDGGLRYAGSLAVKYNKKQQIELKNNALLLLSVLNE